MRASLVLAAAALLALVGTASASDYMLPLLEKQAARGAPQQPAQPQSAIVAPLNPLAAIVGVLGAGAVVTITLLMLRNADRSRAR